MDITNYQKLKDLFWEANRAFIEKDLDLLYEDISERCLCGALLHELNKQLEKNDCNNYYADVEFNRNKKEIKQLHNDDGFVSNILPDIIVHSRGKEILDNLLVLEMKKSSADHQDKENDRNRLRKMTKQNYNGNSYSYEYRLGIYYEINFEKKQILVEFYQDGENVEDKILSYEDTTKRSGKAIEYNRRIQHLVAAYCR